MKTPAYAPDSQAIGSYLTHDQTFMTGNDTQQFLAHNERRKESMETTAAATVDSICRNCGARLTSITDDVCRDARACEERAPFAIPRMHVIEDDTTWSVGLFEQYQNDPRMQIVLDPEQPGAEPKTRPPNLIHVMRMIATGQIEGIDTATQERAARFCVDMHGV